MSAKQIVRSILVLVATAVAVLTAGCEYLDTDEPENLIRLYGGTRAEIGIAPDAMAAIDAQAGAQVHLVARFERFMQPAEERQLENRYGIEILEAVPENAYVVSFPADEAESIIAELETETPPLLAVVSIRDEDKLAPKLGAPGSIKPFPRDFDDDDVSEWDALVPHIMPMVSAPIPHPPDPPAAGSPLYVIVHFFDDVPHNDQLSLLNGFKARLPPDTLDPNADSNQWRIQIAINDISPLLLKDPVRWVEPVPRKAVEDLNEARDVAGYHGNGGGSGVAIGQWEPCRPYTDHPAFGGRLTHPQLPGTSWQTPCKDLTVNIDSVVHPKDFHATMVAGIAGGAPYTDQGNPATNYNGVLQKEFFGLATESDIFAYRTGLRLADLYAGYEDALERGVSISQNSWGAECEVFQEPGAAAYLWTSDLFDRVSSGRDYQGRDLGNPGKILVVTSAGNYGSEKTATSLWGTARVANSAKNALVTGNVNTQPVSETGYWAHLSSGRGPTAEGRLAPVISAPGIRLATVPPQQLASAALPNNQNHQGIRTTYPPNMYKRNWGTSFSAPAVSGAAALLTEAYQNTCPAEPSPMELRALLVHTAHDLTEARSSLGPQLLSELTGESCNLGGMNTPQTLGQDSAFQVREGQVYVGPDFVYGYGMVQTDAARKYAGGSHFLTGSIESGYVEYDIEVAPASLENGKLRVTLAWDDPPWPVNVPPSEYHGLLQNDLDLELVAPGGKRYLPWILYPADPAKPAARNVRSALLPVRPEMRDRRNTIEQVVVDDPQIGTWTIRVRAGRMIRPAQDFALVSAAIVPNTACGGLSHRLVNPWFELPDNETWWWLFWLALIVLLLLIVLTVWLIWTKPPMPGHPLIHTLVLLVLLALAFLLVYRQLWAWLVIFALLTVALAILFDREQPPPASPGQGPP
jgi:hypothetical protein